ADVVVLRGAPRGAWHWGRALHARGGGPGRSMTATAATACSPRTWRWSGADEELQPRAGVLSTHVEVVRRGPSATWHWGRALHARGGGPVPVVTLSTGSRCSPRTWRWSGVRPESAKPQEV